MKGTVALAKKYGALTYLDEILARHTGQPIDRISKDTDRDYFMSPQEAKDYGLIDEVIVTKKAAEATPIAAGEVSLQQTVNVMFELTK